MILRIVFFHIPLRFQFGAWDIRRLIIRPSGRGGIRSGLEQTRPGVVRQDSIRSLIIQTQKLIFCRCKELIEYQRIFVTLHRITTRVKTHLVILQFPFFSFYSRSIRLYLIGRVTHLKRTHVIRIRVLCIRHTLPGLLPVVKMPCTGITRRRRIRVGEVIAFTALHKRDRYLQGSFIMRQGIKSYFF